MFHYFYWLIWIGLGLMVLGLLIKPFMMFVIVPIMTHAKIGEEPRRKHEVADLEKMSPEARAQLERVLVQFREEGFEPLGPPLGSHSRMGSSSVHVLLVNSAGDIAEFFSTAAHQQAFIRSQTFVIRSKFADAKEVDSASSNSPGIFPRNPNIDVVNFRWVKDAYALCEVHRRRLKQLGLANRPRIAPKHGEHEEYLADQGENEYRRVAARGYYYQDPTTGLYRQTWKGAFLMAWKLIWPIKDWRVRRRDRQGQRVWRELQMDQWRLQVPAAAAVQTSEAAWSPGGSRMEYEPQLREGEVHTHVANGVLTVRMGMETRGQFLARQWLQYLVILIFVLAIGLNLYLRWVYARGRPMPGRGAFIYYMWWLLLFWTIGRVIIGALRRRGTVVLVASHSGLTYRNIPSFRGEGEVAREQIGGLMVVLYNFGLRGRTYQLLLRGELSANRLLAFGKDKKELERVGDLLTEAMGVKEESAAAAT